MRIVKHPSTKVLTSPIIRNPTIGTAAITAGTVDQSVLANCTVGTPAITGGTVSAALIVAQPLRLGEGSALEIDGDGEITITHAYHQVDTLGGTATADDLTVINGGAVGDILVLQSVNPNRDVTVKHVAGLRIGSDFVMTNQADKIMLFKAATGWTGLSRSDNL